MVFDLRNINFSLYIQSVWLVLYNFSLQIQTTFHSSVWYNAYYVRIIFQLKSFYFNVHSELYFEIWQRLPISWWPERNTTLGGMPPVKRLWTVQFIQQLFLPNFHLPTWSSQIFREITHGNINIPISLRRGKFVRFYFDIFQTRNLKDISK